MTMKKLFCSVFFAVGFFVAAHAQFTVQGTNTTGGTWDILAKDGNNNLVALPSVGANFSGTNPASSAFSVKVGLTNTNNGCVVSGLISGIGSGTLTGTGSCAIYSVSYSATQLSPGNIVVTLGIN